MTEALDNYIFDIIDKYQLRSLYNSYLLFGNLSYVANEAFVWIALLSKGKPDLQRYFNYGIIALFVIIILNYVRHTLKTKLLVKLYYYSTYDIIDVLKRLPKIDLVNSDVLKIALHFKTLKESFKHWLETRFFATRCIVVIITFILSIHRVYILHIIVLIVIFNGSVLAIYDKVYRQIEHQSNSMYNVEFKLRDFVADAKARILNGNFNDVKLEELQKLICSNVNEINTLEINVGLLSKLSVLAITSILIFGIAKNETILTKIIYLFVTSSLNGFFDAVIEYYRIKTSLTLPSIYSKFITNLRLKANNNSNDSSMYDITELVVNKLENSTPKLKLVSPLTFKRDTYLLDGPSGCGKSSLIRCIKGILKPDTFEYKYKSNGEWKEGTIDSSSYFTLQSYKPQYADTNAKNYISNFDINVDEELVKRCINIVRMDHIVNNDFNIDLNKFSGGEQIRLSLAQMMYDILKHPYQIILLDEMDANLDTDTATEVFTNIFESLKDRIIIVVFHNDKLKRLIKNKIRIKDGSIMN